jgi:hypothetical protein
VDTLRDVYNDRPVSARHVELLVGRLDASGTFASSRALHSITVEDTMKNIVSLAVLALLGLLASCTINPHPMDMTQAVQNAKTRSDHEALARHYEDVAKEMQGKADDHKNMLAQYEKNRNLYGKQAQSLISHCQDLVHIYEQAAAENRRMAESHRQMAAEAK